MENFVRDFSGRRLGRDVGMDITMSVGLVRVHVHIYPDPHPSISVCLHPSRAHTHSIYTYNQINTCSAENMPTYIQKSRTGSPRSCPSMSPALLLASSPRGGPCPSIWLSGMRASCLGGTCYSRPFAKGRGGGGWRSDWVSCKVKLQEAFQKQTEANQAASGCETDLRILFCRQ